MSLAARRLMGRSNSAARLTATALIHIRTAVTHTTIHIIVLGQRCYARVVLVLIL